MIELTHLIYCSTASQSYSDEELAALLQQAQARNIDINVTGMLLYDNGSFFQVIEGPPETISTLFQDISLDTRHNKVIAIIHEPIAKRSFAEWTMGYTRVSVEEVGDIVGLNDFFTDGHCLDQLDSNRARKLLSAFKEGRWRARIQSESNTEIKPANNQSRTSKSTKFSAQISSAFQPIIDSHSQNTIAYEAMPSHLNRQLLNEHELLNYQSSSLHFDSDYYVSAISLANKLGINCDLTFAFRAQQISNAHTTIRSMIDAANKIGRPPGSIILKISQDHLIGEADLFARMIQEFRGVGLKLAIDTFGAGRSSLNLLETYQPDYISLNIQLVTGINSNGARQAVVRGVNQTCQDLGISVIANHVSSFAEFEWFNHEGITLFQGELIAKPEFEKLPSAVIPFLDKG